MTSDSRRCRALVAARGAACAVVLTATAAWGEERKGPLHFTVRPSGIQEGETLDQKLARRDRFRFICIGCVRVPGQADPSAPFEPIRTLNAPQLNRALAAPPELPGEPAPTD